MEKILNPEKIIKLLDDGYTVKTPKGLVIRRNFECKGLPLYVCIFQGKEILSVPSQGLIELLG